MYSRLSLIVVVLAVVLCDADVSNQWHRRRIKRQTNGVVKITSSQQQQQQQQQQKPCPDSCTCNYNIINCNTLITSCRECVHWRQIDFNQIVHINKRAFRDFHFAANQTSNIIIYKLLNSSIGADTFDSLRVPENGQVEVTFQYNSIIKFERHVLRGLRIEKNSTMIFNFPYTTQVIFAPRCFDGVQMLSDSSRLIIRILKSFSVRFLSDFGYYLKSSYFQQHQQQLNSKIKTSNNNNNNNINNDNSLLVNYIEQSSQPSSSSWSIERGTLIIDIKSTHLVKFEEFSLASLELKSGARFYLDLELIEKLMFHRYSFADLAFFTSSRAVLFAKQITFIDFRAFSFAGLVLHDATQLEVYLEELTSSLCLQRNVFSNMRLQRSSSFNFSVINSKNVQLMHDSFSNLTFDGANSRLHIGVYNMPSYLILFHNQNFYGRFMGERLSYLWQSSNFNTYTGHHNHHASHFYNTNPYIISSNNDLYYNRFGSATASGDATSTATTNNEDRMQQKERFYQLNKQIHSYNFSIEKNFFYNLNGGPATTTSHHHNHQHPHVSIVADNLHTLLVDDFLVNYNNSAMAKTRNVDFDFVVNVKNFVLSPSALVYVYNVMIEFVREPLRIKLGLPKFDGLSQSSKRTIRLIGLSLLDNSLQVNPSESINRFNTTSSSLSSLSLSDNFIDYYDDQDTIKQYGRYNKPSNPIIQTKIDGLCNLASLPQSDTRIILVLNRQQQQQTTCSCDMIHLLANQLQSTNDKSSQISQLLSCQMPPDRELFVASCMRKLNTRCNSINGGDETGDKRAFLRGYVRFWEYCINEIDPIYKVPKASETGDLSPQNYGFSSGFGDSSDSGLFAPSSQASSSWPFYDAQSPLSSPSFDDEQLFPFKAEFDSLSPISNNLDQQKWSNNDATAGDNGSSNNGIFKVIGIAIFCIVLAIVLFMITVNIIQYKFRDDLYDDYECSTTNTKAANNGNSPGDNESISSSSTSPRPMTDTSPQSFKPAAAAAESSLLNADGNTTARKNISAAFQSSHFSPVEEVDEDEDDDESDTSSKNYSSSNRKGNPIRGLDNDDDDDDDDFINNDEQLQDDLDDDYEDDEENNRDDVVVVDRRRFRRADESLKKNDSADSSGIASNSNSDQTIVISSPVIAANNNNNNNNKTFDNNNKRKKMTRFTDPSSSVVY